MTKGIKLHEAMAARMRKMAAGFETEIDGDIPEAARRFQKPLLLRPQNPFTGHARRILTEAISASDPQCHGEPGLRLSVSVFNDKAHVADLATAGMREKGQYLIVFNDLTAVYVEEVDQLTRPRILRALPSPLRFRGKHRHLARNEMLPFRARRTLFPLKGEESHFDRGLALGNDSVASRDWLAGEDDRYSPPGTDLTADWITQFEAEIAHLSHRLARQAPHQARPVDTEDQTLLPAVAGPGTIARAAWLMRPAVTDEDMHLGGISFDSTDPFLRDLREVLRTALTIAHAEAAPNLKSADLDLLAATPFQQRVNYRFTGREASENTAIGERLIDMIPLDILDIANRYMVVSPDKIERSLILGGMALIRVSSHQPLPSNHARLEMRGRLGDLLKKMEAEYRNREAF